MFPIDDGSKAEFNLCSEEDVSALQNDAEWLEERFFGLFSYDFFIHGRRYMLVFSRI